MITYDYVSSKNIVNVTPGTRVSFYQIDNYLRDLNNDTCIENDFVEVVDLKHVKEFTVGYNKYPIIVSYFKNLKISKNYRGVVLLGHNKLQLGVAKLLEAMFGEIMDMYIAYNDCELSDSVKKLQDVKSQATRIELHDAMGSTRAWMSQRKEG